MPALSTRLCVLPAVAALAGCGGVSEQRVAALEAQVAELRSAAEESAESGASAGGEELTQRVEALSAETAESVKKMEEMLEILQREVTALAAKVDSGNGGAGGGSDGDPDWYALLDVLGASSDGLESEDNKYTLSRAWLMHKFGALAAASKGPKFIAGKKGGVTVRGVKPKSLLGQLGLSNNDNITAVGDTAVNSVEELAAALRKVESATSVKLLRKKKEVTLEYTINN